jgi:hypothetical protein
MDADALSTTPAAQAALQALRTAAGANGPMERHCLRQFAIAERLQRCMDACEQHHAPRSRLAMGLEVELVRQADLVDVTAGIVNFGLDRQWVRALFRDVPRDGFWRLVGGAVLGELGHRPASLTGVFVSPRRTRA